MKKLALLLAIVLLSCLCMSGCGGEHDEMIEEAIVVLEDFWMDKYDEMEKEGDVERYFEIKNTRVITLHRTEYEELQDIKYIIDFALYVNYYGLEEYYIDAYWLGGAVAVYRDGDMEVVSNRLILDEMFDLTAARPTEKVVKKIDDYDDEFNCEKILD